MAQGVVGDVETWFVQRTGGVIDATIWAPKGSTVDAAQAIALQEHGANAAAVRRHREDRWHVLLPLH